MSLFEKLDKKKITIIGMFGILIAILCIVFYTQFFSLHARARKQLELGQKYLQEMDYEQAAIAFQKVIELEPKNVGAYIGLGQTYEGFAVNLNGDDEEEIFKYYQLAIENYEEVQRLDATEALSFQRLIVLYDNLGDWKKLLALLERYEGEVTDQALKERIENVQMGTELLEQVSQLSSEENYEQIFEIMQGELYQHVQMVAENMARPVLFIQDGKGIGLYPVKTELYGNCMLYYGDYKGEKRQGNGTWLGYWNENNFYSIGEWKNDSPNGKQEVREWNGRLAESVATRVITGKVVAGMWNGPVIWAFEEKDGLVSQYPVSFTNGKWNVVKMVEGEEGVEYQVSEDVGEDCLVTKNIEQKQGIPGFVVGNYSV